jgi:hypothetical protein
MSKSKQLLESPESLRGEIQDLMCSLQTLHLSHAKILAVTGTLSGTLEVLVKLLRKHPELKNYTEHLPQTIHEGWEVIKDIDVNEEIKLHELVEVEINKRLNNSSTWH